MAIEILRTSSHSSFRFRENNQYHFVNEVKGMGKDFIAAISIIGTIIIIGLILRYGGTSVPIVTNVTKSGNQAISNLTLQGTGYPYYPPTGGEVAG